MHSSKSLHRSSIPRSRRTTTPSTRIASRRHLSTTTSRSKTSSPQTAPIQAKKHKASGVDFEFALPPTPHPNYKVVIGLETHAQILSSTKMFSSASTAFKSAPNSNVALFDAAIPGSLPRVNQECVAQVIKTGLALGGKVNQTSFFHRKQYFYCDMPSGYQITQNVPIIKGGKISLDSLLPPNQSHSVGISHIQLEHDSAKSLHDINPYQTHVDLNRAGVALMEIVTTPTIYSAHEAVLYLKKLQALLRFLGTSNANLEEGSMRCDVNITVQRQNPPGEMSQRVEIKNMNSFKHILYAIQSEAMRQIAILEEEYSHNVDMKSSESSIQRETRGYDHKTDSTHRLRSKENLLDYRFFPEPNIPPIVIAPTFVRSMQTSLPILPDQRHSYLMQELGLTQKQSNVILAEDYAFDYFIQIITASQRHKNDTNIQKHASLESWHTAQQQKIKQNTSENGMNSDPTSSLDLTVYRNPSTAYNWLTTELFGRLKRHRESNPAGSTLRHAPLLQTNHIRPQQLADIIDMIQDERVSGKQAKKLLDLLFQPNDSDNDDDNSDTSDDNTNIYSKQTDLSSIDVYELAQQTGNFMDNNPQRVNELIQLVVSIYPDEVKQFVENDKKQFSSFLTGQVIKLSSQQAHGEINPKIASELVVQHLEELKKVNTKQ